MEFHISRQARDRYRFDETLFALDGNVLLANFHGARLFTQKMNQARDLVRFPERAVRAGQINAMGLIDEILHRVCDIYRQQEKAGVLAQALQQLDREMGPEAVDDTLRRFVDEFPPLAVYRQELSPTAYLAGETGGVPNRELALEELTMLWLANSNPALSPFQELFDDAGLERETSYRQLMAGLHRFLDTQPAFGPKHENLLDMLHDPAEVVPHSIPGQLEYIHEHWAYLLGRFFYRLLSSLDLVEEEQKISFMGPGPAQVYDFRAMGLEREPERFSQDLDWMPRLVLLARNAYVWLDQLSRQYRRPIQHLDQIPDQELDTLARWGISGLWLIGLWERSRASRRIKVLLGNPKAVASAYSLFDYQIAAELGGEEAYQALRARAWQRGIRLASDMVPNHMGIDSPWVMEHPDWFLSLPYSPFPAYTFNGPDLSWNEGVEIRIEDHYYDRTDAAVVFQRVDRRSGEERYIYHGNDGTRMPWNDTAQLNYLRPEVREAVIQAILAVARRFPIIRFDAAMTLAKRHYQRLWFPEPGTGGAIPSRAGQGLTREQFDAAIPVEFWREVVDRVAREAPDTLLLAEAFWLMEGYFVRTLGMHRVYNSAFMNMLRDEQNANYRSVMKNTLEFDPEILKRFVNFMNNPDEETAVAQFGKGDKYFGICTMMATLPGLPMFGHGQVEGYSEKYGMEYRYAEWDEQPDAQLVARHEREIFPLLHRRHLFADVEHFLLFDFFTPEGTVNEDVMAYCNRSGEERALVVYHNRYATARGWIRTSVAYRDKKAGEERPLRQKSLGEGLGLQRDERHFCLFRDHLTGLWYIRPSQELWEKGLYAELGAYKCHVFLDLHEVEDDARQQYARLEAYLGGRGVPSIEEALQEVFLQPIHGPLGELVQAGLFRRIVAARAQAGVEYVEAGPLLDEVEGKMRHVLGQFKTFAQGRGDEGCVAGEVRARLEAILRLPGLDLPPEEDQEPSSPTERARAALQRLQAGLDDDPATWGTLLGWLFLHRLGEVVDEPGSPQRSRSWLDEWRLGRVLSWALQDMGLDEGATERAITLVRWLTTHQCWFANLSPLPERGEVDTAAGLPEEQVQRLLQALLQDGDVQRHLQINRYQGVLWFNQESFDQLRWWLLLLAVVDTLSEPGRPAAEQAAEIAARYAIVERLQEAEEASGYQVEKLFGPAAW
jgi:glycosidase